MTDEIVPPAADPVPVGNQLREPTGYEQSLRSQVATLKEQLRTATAKVADMTAGHPVALDALRAELTAAGHERLIAARFAAHAVKAGILDLDAIKLLDLSKVKINPATDALEGVEEILTAAKVAKPYLFGVAPPPIAPGTPAPPSTSSTAVPPAAAPPAPKHASTMTPAELTAEFARLGVRLPG